MIIIHQMVRLHLHTGVNIPYLLFLVDGSWSQWTPWSLCSKTCGEQEETRTRVCENQRNGGLYCSGHDIEVMPCNEYDYVPCPGKLY
jgi:hypothetical protein